MPEFKINWQFNVGADTEEEAKRKVQETMAAFAEFMKWPKPQPMEKAS
jgi:hypothetical protein